MGFFFCTVGFQSSSQYFRRVRRWLDLMTSYDIEMILNFFKICFAFLTRHSTRCFFTIQQFFLKGFFNHFFFVIFSSPKIVGLSTFFPPGAFLKYSLIPKSFLTSTLGDDGSFSSSGIFELSRNRTIFSGQRE